MPAAFPADKTQPFVAENGVTYTWTENRWRTKAYKLDDAALDEYLPKKNPQVAGALTVRPVDWMEQSKFCVTNGSNAYFILKPSSTTEKSQIQYFGLTEGTRDLATVGYVKDKISDATGEFMQVAGGEFTGDVTFKDGTKLKMGGQYNNKIMAGESGYTDNALVSTLGYVKSRLDSLGGGTLIDNFNQSYTTIQGIQTSPIGFNTIALLDSDGIATKSFASIAQVLMSWDQVNPEWLSKTGHIKMTDEGSDRLRGYLTVLDYEVNDGRNVALQVMPGKYGPNTSEIGYGKRLALTFNGVFFGTYDALWSPG